MFISTRRPGRFGAPIRTSALLVMGFLFCQPDAGLAQTNWSGGILNRAAEAIRAHSRAPQNQSGIQSKTGAKGSVAIQSMTQGRIAKFQNGSGTLEDSVITESTGNVGIGTVNPTATLEVAGRILSTGTAAENSFQDRTSTRQWTWYGTGDMARFWNSGIGDMLFVTPSGNVGIGAIPATSNKLHVAGSAYVTGNLTVDGNIAAKYQDVAEWVPARHAISPGTVVVLDSERSNHVLPCARAYDTRVAGVVSAKPGVLLGERGEGKVMVATTGRVRIKVDATNAPIRVGDLLVTSDKQGIAMRSLPLDLGGTPIHRPGTLIGKALEPLEKGVGEILVLLSLQ